MSNRVKSKERFLIIKALRQFWDDNANKFSDSESVLQSDELLPEEKKILAEALKNCEKMTKPKERKKTKSKNSKNASIVSEEITSDFSKKKEGNCEHSRD